MIKLRDLVSEKLNTSQAKELLQQLGGNKFKAMTGAKDFGIGNDGYKVSKSISILLPTVSMDIPTTDAELLALIYPPNRELWFIWSTQAAAVLIALEPVTTNLSVEDDGQDVNVLPL